ncbi:MAG: hypothetical protein C0459_11785 [Chitinophaga sp.]|jgi:hypothetical protein|nr:hypothetical protein [Chitinophaga sp.]
MITKTNLGSNFRGLVNYLTGAKEKEEDLKEIVSNQHTIAVSRGQLLYCHKLTADKEMMIEELNAQAASYEDSRSNGKYVWHTKISFAPEDIVNEQMMQEVINEYAEANQLYDTQFFAVRHDDTPNHAQIHIMANRVMDNGKLLSHADINRRDILFSRTMEEKHGLRKVGNKKHLENINLHHFGNIADRQKIQIYSAIKDALLITTDKNELYAMLAKMNVSIRANVNNPEEFIFCLTQAIENEKQYSFKGRTIDAGLTGNQIINKLQQNKERQQIKPMQVEKHIIETVLAAKHLSTDMRDFAFRLHQENIIAEHSNNIISYTLIEPNSNQIHRLAIDTKYPDIALAICKASIERTIHQKAAILESKNKQEAKKESKSKNNKEQLKQILLTAKQNAIDIASYRSILEKQDIDVYERGKEINYAITNAEGKITKYRGSSIDATLTKEALHEAFAINKQQIQQSDRNTVPVEANNQAELTVISTTSEPLAIAAINEKLLFNLILQHCFNENPDEETATVKSLNRQDNKIKNRAFSKQDKYIALHQILTAMLSSKHGYNQVQLKAFKQNLQTHRIELILLYKDGKIYGGYYQKKTANGAVIRIPASILGIDFTISNLIEKDDSYNQAMLEQLQSHLFWHELLMILQKDLLPKDPHNRFTVEAVGKMAEFAFSIVFPFLPMEFKIERKAPEQLLKVDTEKAKQYTYQYGNNQRKFKR